MIYSIGIDIGGSKVAGAAYDALGREIEKIIVQLPPDYPSLLEVCRVIVEQLEQKNGRARTLGACAPYADAQISANIPYLVGQSLQKDLETTLARKVPMSNDANCAALVEALEGSGKGYASVFGLILGTGVGGGFVVNGRLFSGANGLCGEIGHLPLSHYEITDGAYVSCGCGQKGCIDKLISGGALARLHHAMTGQHAEPRVIAEQAQLGNASANHVLDQYYTVVAKAMVTILHSFDPDIITVSGGLNALPGLYVEVPKRWGFYAISKNPSTKFVSSTFGALAGLRGAALLGESF